MEGALSLHHLQSKQRTFQPVLKDPWSRHSIGVAIPVYLLFLSVDTTTQRRLTIVDANCSATYTSDNHITLFHMVSNCCSFTFSFLSLAVPSMNEDTVKKNVSHDC